MPATTVKVLFIAGFGPIVRDAAPSRKLYAEDLGLSFTEESGGYLHTEKLECPKYCALVAVASRAVLLRQGVLASRYPRTASVARV